MNQLALAQHDDDQAPRSDDELGPLLRRALGHPILTAADEVRLARRIERGDLVAKNQMIESNLRLVASIARRYRGGALSYSDLVQEGTIGLVRAVEKFDHRRGLKFSTYATFWIRREVTRALGEATTIRIPAHARRRIAAVDRPRVTASLDRTLEDGRETLADQIADDGPVGTAEQVGESDEARRLREIVGVLPARHREVVRRRFGLEGGRPETHREIAESFGISEARSSQIEREALQRLRQTTSRWTAPALPRGA